MEELLKLHDKAKEIVQSNLSWEAKYDIIFSEVLAKRVYEIARGFSYYDPDSSYEADVMAFYNAFTDYITEGE